MLTVSALNQYYGGSHILRDVGFENALYRAYHRWVVDFCAQAPKRLKWTLVANMRDVPSGVAELKYWAERDPNLVGVYISPQGQSAMAAGDLSVNANFSTRSLAFSSSATSITLDARSATAAPHLDLKGTLSYAPNTNSFSGTLANPGGTLSGSSQGKFYGPAAQELGGAFTVKSSTTVETFTGAYGAKR